MARPWDVEKRRFWGAQLDAWQRSGLTQAEFCRRQGIDRRLLGSWKRRLGMAPRGQCLPVEFIAVPVRPQGDRESAGCAVPPASPLTLVIRGGYRIEVGEGFAPETLTRLLTTLGRL